MKLDILRCNYKTMEKKTENVFRASDVSKNSQTSKAERSCRKVDCLNL